MRVRARAGLRGRVGGVSAGYLARLIGGSMPAGVVVVTWLGLGLGSRLASPNPNPNPDQASGRISRARSSRRSPSPRTTAWCRAPSPTSNVLRGGCAQPLARTSHALAPSKLPLSPLSAPSQLPLSTLCLPPTLTRGAPSVRIYVTAMCVSPIAFADVRSLSPPPCIEN